MSDQKLYQVLSFYGAKGLRPNLFKRLIDRYHHVGAVLQALPEIKRKGLLSDLTCQSIDQPNVKDIESLIHWHQPKHKQFIIPFGDELYPPLLKELSDPPLVLWVRGDPQRLQDPQLAVVGSRSMNHYGRSNAFHFSECLAQSGLTITSGLAYGIDSQAHLGAMNSGYTIAVLGSGLDCIYPKSNQQLAEKIIDKGALVSLWPPETSPLAFHFPQRNRVICGLSLGVLVVQAALKSGSLISAKLALEQGKEVFAIPGSIHSPIAKGVHELIRQGALLVEDASQVMHALQDVLSPYLNSSPECIKSLKEPTPSLSSGYDKLLELIGYEPIDFDQLLALTEFEVPVLSSMLLRLECDGRVHQVDGGYVTCIKNN